MRYFPSEIREAKKKEFAIISDWAGNCKTLEQLAGIERLFDRKNELIYGTRHIDLIFNSGVTHGVILYKKHTLKNKS